MNPPPWRRLKDRLDADFGASELRPVRTRLGVEAAHEALESEILREMASALGRTGDKVGDALDRLLELGAAVDAAPDVATRAELVVEFNAAREVAVAARFDLMVHRESMGLRRQDDLDTFYPIPPRR